MGRQTSLFDFGIKKRRDPAVELEKFDAGEQGPSTKRRKRDVPKGRDAAQLTLDAGQRDLGCKECPKCGMVYTPGTEDDALHAKHCAAAEEKVRCGARWWCADDEVGGDFLHKVVLCSPADEFRPQVEDALRAFAGGKQGGAAFGAPPTHTLLFAVDASNLILAAASVQRFPAGADGIPQGVLVGVSSFLAHPATTTSDVAGLLLEAVVSSSIHGYSLKPSQLAISADVDVAQLPFSPADVPAFPTITYA